MNLLSSLNIAVPGIAFFTGLFCFRSLSKNFKLVLIFTALAFFTEITLRVLLENGVKSTLPGLHFYIMAEFLLWALFYRNMLHPYIHKNILAACILIFEMYVVINVVFIQDLFTMPHLARAIEGLILVVFSVVLFSKIMLETKYRKLWTEPIIWLNLAVLFYFSGNFFFNILFNIILEYSIEFSRLTVRYYNISSVIFYLLITTSFILSKNRQSN